MTLRIESAGALTTVQDLGRPGYGSIGVPPCGAMDSLAVRAANRLAGDPDAAAALEITMAGPTIVFTAGHVLALAGALIEADLDGKPVPHGETFSASAGQTLRLGRVYAGARTYLAVRGGIQVHPVLGSRATHAAAGLGGLGGRALAEGDVLSVGRGDHRVPFKRMLAAALPLYDPECELRAIPGPQEEAFTEAGRDLFFSGEWRVSTRSDRAGVRLEGPALEHVGAADLDPEGVVTGAVQVPGDGLPIVLGPDRPATGGYAKIATVIWGDLPLLAQARPGDRIRFTPATVERGLATAHRRLADLDEGIAAIEDDE